MTTRIAVAARNDAADAITALLDAGAGPGYIEIRDGTQPADPDTAASGVLLATLTLSDPAFGAAASGTATANAIASETNAPNSGTATWFRAYDSTAVAVIDGDVGTSGTDMVLNTTTITAGDTVEVTEWTVTMPVG